jgi:phytoene dehydrogenase-like protein
MNQYDVVIIGGGHNGLVCACYLAGAGLKVRVLERRNIVGGAAVTEEFHPGFRNSVASYTVSLLNPKVIEDLNLYANGLKIVERPFSNFLPLADGQYLKTGVTLAETQAEFARFSKADAEKLPAYYEMLEGVADVLRSMLLETPPNVGGGFTDIVQAAKVGNRMRKLSMEGRRDVLDLFAKSAGDLLDSWFETDAIKAVFGFDSIVGTFSGPYTPGSAYILLHHVFGEVNGKRGLWGHAIGGMGAITQAMAKEALKRGVEITTDAAVSQVIVKDGVTSGILLENGEEISAGCIASNVNPKLLYLDLIDKSDLEPEFFNRIKNWKCGSATFRMNVALSELPDFTCLPGKHQQPHHESGIIIAPSMDYMERAYMDAYRSGWAKQPIVEMVVSSALDSTLAPESQHVASLFCQHFNPNLPDGKSWDECKETAADLIIDTVNEHAPNFKQSVLGRQVLSPLDLERTFGLVGGDIMHGALTLDQLYSARPMLGYGDYRGPIKGLYMCGSGTHPGGGVTGAPGHNAAREILRDYGRSKVKSDS